MKTVLLFPSTTLLLLALTGCGKESADTGSAPVPTTNSPAAAIAQPAPRHVVANAQNEVAQNVAGEVNPFLTEQLGIFIRQKGRMPQSFSELAAARLDSMPVAPAGKKWVIDSTTSQVKAVKAE